LIALLFTASLAMAHGGEDHAAPAAAHTVLSEDAASVGAASSRFEAVLRVPIVPVGSETEVTLLLADFATSAPVEGATASLTLSGPGLVQAELGSAGPPGLYHGAAALPGYGDFAGALIVTPPPESGGVDLLSVTGLHIAAAEASGLQGASLWAALLVNTGRIAILVSIGLLGVLVGWLLGRRQGATVAAMLFALGLGAMSRRVKAHGGEDHGEATTARAAPAGSSLSLPMDGQFLVGLRTAVVARDGFQDRAPALGRFVARPGEAATLGAPVSGVLVAPSGGFPSPGQAVRAGDTLALVVEVPSTADRAALAQERGDAATRMAEAKAALTLAERDLAAIDALGDALSERERVERRNAVEVARVAVRESVAAFASFAGGLTVPVKAPVSGRLGAISARPGDQVEAGRLLFRVVDAAGLWMEADVPERLALGLRPGALARVTPAAAPDRELVATVLDAGQEADPATGAVRLTLAVDAGELGLLPGMGATAWIGRGGLRDALIVPSAAVIDSNGTRLAFVKTGPETFEARELHLGGRAGSSWEVHGGLAEGERVVIDGAYTLRSIAGR